MAAEGDRRRSPSGRGETPRRRHEDAAGQSVAYLLAGAVLFAAATTVVLTTEQGGRDAAPYDDARRDVRAHDLASWLLASSGSVGEPGLVPGGLGIGLLDDDGVGLSRAAIDAMAAAGYEADPDNNLPDYLELRAQLGLAGQNETTGYDFQIRMLPKVSGYLDMRDVRIGYIGAWDGDVEATVQLGTDPQMIADARAEIDLAQSNEAMLERQAIASLGGVFNDGVHLDDAMSDVEVEILPAVEVPLLPYMGVTSVVGDVFPDDSSYLSLVMPLVIARYDILFVGSGVNSQALNSAPIKQPLQDWVMDDNGTLIVFASDSGNKPWLGPMVTAAVNPTNDPPVLTSHTHPLVRTPSPLRAADYDHQGRAWNIAQGDIDDFASIVVAGDDAALAVSRPHNEYGDVVLSSLSPANVAQVFSAGEAASFVDNTVTYVATQGLWLDYGPAPPRDRAVSAAVRIVSVEDDRFGSIPVEWRLLLWER